MNYGNSSCLAIAEEDRLLLAAIKKVTDSGNDAEVRKNKDGSLKVYEVEKHIVRSKI